MKKHIFKITTLVVCTFFAVGCEDDFLSTTPLEEIADTGVWTDKALAEAAVLDLYQYTWAGPLSDEITSDAFTDHAVFTHPGRGVDGYTEGKMNPAGNYKFMEWFEWEDSYKFIRGANTAILNLTANEAGFEEGLVTRLLGEAYFMRGHMYTQLLRQYGGVVVITELADLDTDVSTFARNTFEETVNQIVSDLDQAIVLLADAPLSKARANKLTAMALKSRVLTHAASDLYEPTKASVVSTISSYGNKELIGYTSGSQTSRWEAAKIASKALLDATSGYKLDYAAPASQEEAIQNYEDIWLQGGDNQDFIWGRLIKEFGYDSRTYDGGNGWSQGPGMVALYHGPNGYHEWAGTTPAEALISKYEFADGTTFDWDNPAHAADPYTDREARFYATFLFDGASWKERTDDVVKHDNFNEIQTGFYTFLNGDIKNGVDTRQGPIEDWNGSRTGYYFKKYSDPTIAASWPSNLQKVDAPYLRYTEVLLNYVEANIGTGDEGEAVAWLNKLRYRNGLPATTASGSDLVELYRRERDKELVNEDTRLFDMRRWLEGPYSLNKPAQQIVISGTQKPGTTVENYKKDPTVWDYTYTPTDLVFENRVWQDKVYFTPIEQQEMDRAPSLIQNPGY